MKGGILQTQEFKNFSRLLKTNIINPEFGATNKEEDRVRESQLQIVLQNRVANMEDGENIASITNELIQANKQSQAKPTYAESYKSYLEAVGPKSDLNNALRDGMGKDEYNAIANEIQNWFQVNNAYADFRQDYDLIMKGL
jgi:ABC-type glutathione transport system ATPase component